MFFVVLFQTSSLAYVYIFLVQRSRVRVFLYRSTRDVNQLITRLYLVVASQANVRTVCGTCTVLLYHPWSKAQVYYSAIKYERYLRVWWVLREKK